MEVVKLLNKAYLEIYPNNSDTIILVIPGGAYSHLSERESKPVASKFANFGYDTAILYYSVAPFLIASPLDEGNRAVELLVSRYKNIFVIGFSAGGHLAGLMATDKYSNHIKGLLLCYPVITLGEHTHVVSRDNFLNKKVNSININKYSVEKRVNSSTCPTFIWTCKTDEAVPYENSLAMIESLKNNNVYYEELIFDHGKHGMALADKTAIKDGDTSYVDKEISTWVDRANMFIKKVSNNAKND